jgi:hypothetical protein
MSNNAKKPPRIIKLTQAMAILEAGLEGEGEIRIACEPDEVVDTKMAAGKGDQLWCFYMVERLGKKVAEIGRVDLKFFLIWFIYNVVFKICQPYLEQEPKLELYPAGRKEIGKVLVPVTNLRIDGGDRGRT